MPRTLLHGSLDRLDHGVLLALEPVDEQAEARVAEAHDDDRVARVPGAGAAQAELRVQAPQRQRLAAQVEELAALAALDLRGVDQQRLEHRVQRDREALLADADDERLDDRERDRAA